MGPAESSVWTWKDELPAAGLLWYGKFLYKRASLLSPRLLMALYAGSGDARDHEAFDLPAEAPNPISMARIRAARSGRITMGASRPLEPWTVITRMRSPATSIWRFTSTSSWPRHSRKPVSEGTASCS